MSYQKNNSLVGFLAKKSLFSNSPQKNLSKKRQKSKQPRQFIANSQTNIKQDLNFKSINKQSARGSQPKLNIQKTNQFDEQYTTSQKNHQIKYPNMNSSDIERDQRRNINPQQNSRFKMGVGKKIQYSNFDPNKQLYHPQIRKNNNQETIDQKIQNQKFVNLIVNSISFQSSRLQSIRCLSDLSDKIHTQISTINSKLQKFNRQMNTIINNEFKKLKKNIYDIIDRVFIESQKTIRSFMKTQQQKFAGELLKMRQDLQNQFNKIQNMKEDINKPQKWRQVAGELLSTELQKKIEEKLQKISLIAIEPWSIGDLGGQKVRTLQQHMKEIVKLHK